MDKNIRHNHSGPCTSEDIEQIFKRLYGPLCHYAYTFILDEVGAEDMVQDAFASYIGRRSGDAGIRSADSYLYKTVKHKCLEYFRSLNIVDRYMQKQAEALLFSFADDNDIEDGDEVKIKVQTALAQLSKQQRTVVELHIIQGMKYQQIAESLSISENSVRTHLKRAYKVLRDHLVSVIPCAFL